MSQPHPTEFTRVRVDSAGRVVVPADLRDKLGIGPGDDLILSADQQGIHLHTFSQAVQAAQEALAPYRISGVSVVDELIREREEEARREYGE
jgi:AbrB family looped-hinge helix DNA binding protein